MLTLKILDKLNIDVICIFCVPQVFLGLSALHLN